MAWAAAYDDPTFRGRSRTGHAAWLSTLDCPVLSLDSDAPVAHLVDAITAWQP
jgi:hypothetical protein